jgi:DNA-directed RNA polymerase subunit K/omega
MTDEIEAQTDAAESDEAPLAPAPPITDRFLFVDVASLRAKQLRRGALSRLPHEDSRTEAPNKPERVAMEEVRRGLVQYEVPTSTRPQTVEAGS